MILKHLVEKGDSYDRVMNEGFSGSSCIRVCTRYLRAICLSLFYLPVSTTLAESTGLFPDILLILREGEANPLYFHSHPLNSRSLPSTTSFAILLIIGLTELFFYSQNFPIFQSLSVECNLPVSILALHQIQIPIFL